MRYCVYSETAAQDSMNALARYRGEEASHRTHASHSENLVQTFPNSSFRYSEIIFSFTINRSAASFETIILLFYSCFAHTFIPKGLHHLNSFRTRLSELKTKFDANSLISFFSHF